MAQPFETRLATGLRSHAQNCETLRSLIAETEAEKDRQLDLQRRSEVDAVDVLLNPTERDEAAVAADKARRMAHGYANALDQLRAKLTAKEESDRRKAREDEHSAALTERNDIAARFAATVPAAVETLTALFLEVEANTARLKAAGIFERDAEAEARNVPGNYRSGTALIDSFTGMKIPSWTGNGRAWPLDPQAAQRAAIAEEDRRRRLEHERTKSPEARAAREAARAVEEAKWGRYRVSHSKFGFLEVDCRTGTAAILGCDRMVFEMSEEQVAAARAKGAKVEQADEDDRSGLHAKLAFSEPF